MPIYERVSKIEVLEAFDITDGNIMQSAELLNISPQTIYNYLKHDEDLEDKLLFARKGQCIKYCDVAEFMILKIMQKTEEHPGHALNASKYYLETHAKKRNYGVQKESTDSPPLEKDIDYKVENMRLSHKIKEMELKLANLGQTESEPIPSDTQIQHLGGSCEIGQDL